MMKTPLRRCTKGKKAVKGRKKPTVSEDWCFECKDGGDLICCEFKDCFKSFHPKCAGKPDDFASTNERFFCGWHICSRCAKSSKFQCFNCPCGVCESCLSTTRFVIVRGKRGLCEDCLELIRVIENYSGSSEEQKVEIEDEAADFLFLEYWDIVKDQEGLIPSDLRFAISLFDKNRNCGSDSDEYVDSDEENQSLSSSSDKKRKVKSMEGSKEWGKVKSKKREFGEWASKSLMDFLAAIGKDTSKPLTPLEVNDIFMRYINEHGLQGSEKKKKKVVCDNLLRTIFPKKTFHRNHMRELLEQHFVQNQVVSEEEDMECCPEEVDDTDDSRKPKRQKSMRSGEILLKQKKVLKTPKSCFAAITAENMKPVYLRRSLVQNLLKDMETFNEKVLGSFVRLKADKYDFSQKNPYQLEQVKGITNALRSGDTSTEVMLKVTVLNKEVPVKLLCDDDFSEEECADLHQRMKAGVHKKLTIMELEQKSRLLHEDITNHWISKELVKLQHLIDRANEKGWRRELGDYLERRQLLQNPAEQQRLLLEVPQVVAEEIEVTSVEPLIDMNVGDDDSPQYVLLTESEILHELADTAEIGQCADVIPTRNVDLRGTYTKTDQGGQVDAMDEASGNRASKVSGVLYSTTEVVTSDAIYALTRENFTSDKLEEKSGSKEGISADDKSAINEERLINARYGHQTNEVTATGVTFNSDMSAKKEDLGKNVEKTLVVKESVTSREVIVVDDDEDNEEGIVPDKNIWHYIDPQGTVQGPFSLLALKDWKDKGYFVDPSFKVWKTSETQEASILLTEALRRV